MTNEIKFADTVILVDVAYVDRVAGDLSKHFGDVVGRKLPKADLPVLLECLSLDSGIPLGENAVQVLFIYDEESKKMDAFMLRLWKSDYQRLRITLEMLTKKRQVLAVFLIILRMRYRNYRHSLEQLYQRQELSYVKMRLKNMISHSGIKNC